MSTEKFLFEIAADTKALREELGTGKTSVKKFNSETEGMLGSLGDLKTPLTAVATGVATVTTAVVAGTAALVSYAAAQGKTIQETETMANIAGLTVEEFKRMSFVMGTVGLDGEKFGDIMKDTQEKIGDFLATGGGAFQDFADVMGYTAEEATALAGEFETMSGQEVLQAMVTRMEEAGKSSQQMSFALEGMASDTTALIPLLKEGGAAAKELGDTFDSINVELSEEERAQFAALANNVDLAQTSFVNFLNNAIAPFLPAINAATKALAEFFAARQTGMDLERIIDDGAMADRITSLGELETLQKLLNEKVEEYEGLTQHGRSGKANKERLKELRETVLVLEARKAAIEEENRVTQEAIDLEAKKGNLKGEKTTGADSIKLEEALLAELKAREDAQKSELQLLEEQKTARYAVLERMFEDENKLTEEKLKEKNALKKAIEADYLEQARELAQTEEQAKLEAAVTEAETQQELLDAKLISQEEYQAKLQEIIAAYSPESVDPEALEEKNQAELDSLNNKLENQLISYEDYFSKISALSKKDTDDKKKKTDLENFWSESSVKNQIDLGTSLLTSLGNNSKTAHKIQQGLSAANAGMNTGEGVTKALAKQDYAGATFTALTGAAQIAAILASTPDGSSTVAPVSTPTETTTESYNEQSATVTDVSDGGISTQRLVIEFSDEAVDAVGRHVDNAKRLGRI